MKLHIVDGTYELFRAWFSKRPGHVTPDGWEAKAVAGVMSSLLYLLDDPAESVTHVAVAFDNPIRSFRNDLFDGYKTEEGVPEELLRQFDPVEEAVRALGIVAWPMDRWEADDAMATAAARWAGEVDEVRLMTPDKDLGQCIRGNRGAGTRPLVQQVNRLTGRVLDEDGLIALRGIRPESIPDYLALIGDDADGIPGLPGFGEKGTAQLLAHYLHLEQIPDEVARWAVRPRGAERMALALAQSREAVALYKKLATLVSDVPLKESLDDLRFRGVPRARFEAFCDQLGLTTLRTRPTRWA